LSINFEILISKRRAQREEGENGAMDKIDRQTSSGRSAKNYINWSSNSEYMNLCAT